MSFDATIGGDSANSYSDVAFADDHFSTRINSGWWSALTTEQKQAYLVTATLALETWVDWRGTPATEEQALHFPATGTDCKGKELPEESVPVAISRAVCEQANYYQGLDATELPAALLQGLASAAVGSLKVAFDRQNIPGRIGETAQGLVYCYGTLKPGATGGRGAGSVRIFRL